MAPTAERVLKGVDDVFAGDMQTPEAQEFLASGQPAPEEPEAEEPKLLHVELADGNVVDMTAAMSARDMLDVLAIQGYDTKNEAQMTQAFVKVAQFVERHTVRHSFPDPDILAQPAERIAKIFEGYNAARKGVALPKPTGNRSQWRSQKRR